jgi:hypothetical protein
MTAWLRVGSPAAALAACAAALAFGPRLLPGLPYDLVDDAAG